MGLRRSSYDLGQLAQLMRDKEAFYRRAGYIASADVFKARAAQLDRQQQDALAREAESLCLAPRPHLRGPCGAHCDNSCSACYHLGARL